MAKPRIKFPRKAKAGDVVQIKTLISHKMESGNRKNKKTGKKIPRNIINTFSAAFEGKEVFKADLQPSVSANPYIAFFYKVSGPGKMTFTWTDDGGKVITASKVMKIG